MSDEKKPDNLEAVLIGVATLVLLPVFMFLDGWAISTLWGWFAVPLGAPPVSILHGIGLMLLVGVAVARPPQTKDTRTGTERLAALAGFQLGAPLLALLLGAIVRAFMGAA